MGFFTLPSNTLIPINSTTGVSVVHQSSVSFHQGNGQLLEEVFGGGACVSRVCLVRFPNPLDFRGDFQVRRGPCLGLPISETGCTPLCIYTEASMAPDVEQLHFVNDRQFCSSAKFLFPCVLEIQCQYVCMSGKVMLCIKKGLNR